MAIWISLAVVLCLIPGHDSASTKTGCVIAVKVISSNGTLTYTCQAQNKDNNITWISNGAQMQIVLATCLNGSTTCLTRDPSVHASRTETGWSELKIIGSVGGKDIKCHESSDSKEITCSQSTTAVTSTTGQGNRNSDNQSEPSAGPKISSENPSFTPFVASMTSVQDVTREKTSEVSSILQTASAIRSEQFLVTTTLAPTGKPSQDSNHTFTKSTIVSVSTLEGHPITDATVFSPQTLKTSEDTVKDSTTINTKSTVSLTSNLDTSMHITPTQVLTTTERKQQVSSAVSSFSGSVIELSQTYVLKEIVGEGTLSTGVKLTPTPARTTTVSPVTDSLQTVTIEDSNITKYSDISSQTNTLYLVSGFSQISGFTMSSFSVSPEYFLITERESLMASTTDSQKNKQHVTSYLSPVLIVSSMQMSFVESFVDNTQRSASFEDNTKGSHSGESSASVSLTPELLSSTESSKSQPFTIYPENLTSKSTLKTELASTFTSKIERDGYFTNLETVASSQNVQEVPGPFAHTNKVNLHTSNTFILKETEVASSGKTEVITFVKPTMTTSPLHETESTHFRSLTGLSTLNTRNVPTIDTVMASSELNTDSIMFDRSLQTDAVYIQSHQEIVATVDPHIYLNTASLSIYDRDISVSSDTRMSRSSSLDFTQSTFKNEAGFSAQETATSFYIQAKLLSTFIQDDPDVTKLLTRFSTHESYRTTIDVQTSAKADLSDTLNNSLKEVLPTKSQIDVQIHRGTSADTTPAKTNTADKHPHNISRTPSTVGPIPTSRDKMAHLSLIIGVIAAVLGLVVLGSLYILICKHHRDSMTFSDDVSTKDFIYCNITYGNEGNDETKKVGEAPSGLDKNKAPLTLKTFRRLSLSKSCVLREEIESPYDMVANDANSVGKVSTASVSMETDSVSLSSAEADDMDSDVSLFAVTSPGTSCTNSFEENESQSQVSDCPDDVTQHEKNQTDVFSSYAVVKRANFKPPATKKALIWRPLYDRMAYDENEPEYTLYSAIVVAKPSRFQKSIMKSRGSLEPVDEREEKLLDVATKKQKKVVSFEDATVSQVNHKPKGGEDSKDIQLEDKSQDNLIPPVSAAVSKATPE